MECAWAWWVLGGIVFILLGLLFLALASAGDRITPEEEARLLWEQEQERKKAKATKEAMKAQRKAGRNR